MRLNTILSRPLVVGIMALAVVVFLFVIDTANNPDGVGGLYVFPKRQAVNTNVGEAANANVNQNTNSLPASNTNSVAVAAFNLSTPSATKDWEIYTSATYGYSVRYPSDYTLAADNPRSVSLTKTIPPGDVNQGENGGSNIVAILIFDQSTVSASQSTVQREYAWAIGGFTDARPDYLSTPVAGLINGTAWQRVSATSGLEAVQGYYHVDGEQVVLISDSRIMSMGTNELIVSSFTMAN